MCIRDSLNGVIFLSTSQLFLGNLVVVCFNIIWIRLWKFKYNDEFKACCTDNIVKNVNKYIGDGIRINKDTLSLKL